MVLVDPLSQLGGVLRYFIAEGSGWPPRPAACSEGACYARLQVSNEAAFEAGSLEAKHDQGVLSCAGAAVFTVYGSADQQDFSNNEPFAFEANPAVSWVRKLPFFNKDKSE